MSSTAQVLANQTNAAASTGPRTEAGKAASSENALKHRATSKNVVLSFEDPAEFEAMRQDFYLQCCPATGLERIHVNELASLQWRLDRAGRMVTAYTDREISLFDPSADPMLVMSEIVLTPAIQRLTKYENGFRRAFESTWKRLKDLQRRRECQQAEVPNEQNEPIPAKVQPAPPPAATAKCQKEPNLSEPMVATAGPTGSPARIELTDDRGAAVAPRLKR